MMDTFNAEQVRRIDAGLKHLEKMKVGVYSDSTDLWMAMGQDSGLRSIMTELGLITWRHTSVRLSIEGRKAAAMGFRAWMEQRERKVLEPQKVKFVEERFLGLSRSVWYQVIGWSICLLGALACFL